MDLENGRLSTENDLRDAMNWRNRLIHEQREDDRRRQEELDETKKWYEAATSRRQDTLGRIDMRIDDFTLRRLKEDPTYRFRSRYGSVSKRKVTIFTHDDSKLIDSVPEEYIKIKRELEWGKFKKKLTATDDGRAVNEDGEIVDGVTTTKGTKVIIKSSEEEK